MKTRILLRRTLLIGVGAFLLLIAAFVLPGLFIRVNGEAGGHLSGITATPELSATPALSATDLPMPVETVMALATHAAQATAQPIPTLLAKPTSVAQPLAQHSYGVWGYEAGIGDDGALRISITCNCNSAQDFQTYASANRSLAQTLKAGTLVEVHITFNSYIEPDAFREWAKLVNLRVEGSLLRGLNGQKNPNTNRVTSFVQAQEGDPLPQETIDQLIASNNEDAASGSTGASATLQGVFNTYGTLDAGQIPLLLADPQILIVDVTPNIVRADLHAAGVSNTEQAIVTISMDFWRIEDLGLLQAK